VARHASEGLSADAGGAWFRPPPLDGGGFTSASDLEHHPPVGLALHIPASGTPGRRAALRTSPVQCRSNLRPSKVEVRPLLGLHSRASCTVAQTKISKSGLAGGTPAVSPPDTSTQESPKAPLAVAP
jgi:hypothetical protein